MSQRVDERVADLVVEPIAAEPTWLREIEQAVPLAELEAATASAEPTTDDSTSRSDTTASSSEARKMSGALSKRRMATRRGPRESSVRSPRLCTRQGNWFMVPTNPATKVLTGSS